jgi:hypothetical protein
MADIGEINQYITSDCIEDWLHKEYNESFIIKIWDLLSADKSNCGMLVLLATSLLVLMSMLTSLILSICRASSRRHKKAAERLRLTQSICAIKKGNSSDVFESLLIDDDFMKGYSNN